MIPMQHACAPLRDFVFENMHTTRTMCVSSCDVMRKSEAPCLPSRGENRFEDRTRISFAPLYPFRVRIRQPEVLTPESPGSNFEWAGIPGIELRASRNPRDRHSVVRKYKVANAGIPGIEVVQCRNPRDRTSSEPESPGSAQRRTKIQSSKCRNPRDRSRTMPESPGSNFKRAGIPGIGTASYENTK